MAESMPDGLLMLQVNLPLAGKIHPQNNKFVTPHRYEVQHHRWIKTWWQTWSLHKDNFAQKNYKRCRDSMIPSDYQVPLIMICFSALLPISAPSNVFIKIRTPTLIGTLILILFSLAMQGYNGQQAMSNSHGKGPFDAFIKSHVKDTAPESL